MEKLITPFGEIKIRIDGRSVPYIAQEGRQQDAVCPHLLGRYRISVPFIPDSKAHTVACVFDSDCSYERTAESGERLEYQSFYNDRRFKMTIGVEGEAGGIRAIDAYDYDVDYLENGMSFLVNTNTRTECYVFGIAWIDNVGRDDPMDHNDRDVETWYGSDPALTL